MPRCFDALAGQPGQAEYTGSTLMSVLLVGGLDRASGAMALFGFGFGSDDAFEPRLLGMPCVGARPQDHEVASRFLMSAVRRGADVVADACPLALQEVAKVNPEVGPTGHVVIIRPTGSELRPF